MFLRSCSSWMIIVVCACENIRENIETRSQETERKRRINWSGGKKDEERRRLIQLRSKRGKSRKIRNVLACVEKAISFLLSLSRVPSRVLPRVSSSFSFNEEDPLTKSFESFKNRARKRRFLCFRIPFAISRWKNVRRGGKKGIRVSRKSFCKIYPSTTIDAYFSRLVFSKRRGGSRFLHHQRERILYITRVFSRIIDSRGLSSSSGG